MRRLLPVPTCRMPLMVPRIHCHACGICSSANTEKQGAVNSISLSV